MREQKKSFMRTRTAKRHGRGGNGTSLLRRAVPYLLPVAVAAVVVILIIHFMRPGRRSVVPDRFFDHLAGKPYSKEDYDGIDISKHQGVIKWEEVAKNKKIQFVYIRATMGKGHPDKRYAKNIDGARHACLKIGSYHFLTSKFSIDEQFKSFLSVADPDRQDIIPMVDVEEGYFDGWSREQLQDSLAKFSRLVKEHYGHSPVIYSSEHFYNTMLSPRFNGYILYIANYRTSPTIKGNGNHNLWQYSEHGHIRGIGEYVDLCRFTHSTTIDDIIIKRNRNK